MKKNYHLLDRLLLFKKKSVSKAVLTASGVLMTIGVVNAQTVTQHYADSVRAVANAKVNTDYTVPSFTLLKRAIVTSGTGTDSLKIAKLSTAMNNLASKFFPYNVNMTLNGDPTSRMGFAWYTNSGIATGSVQIVEGIVDTTAFGSATTFNAWTTNVNNVPYCNSNNMLVALAGIPNTQKYSYVSHKAVATGLKANTTYSYRVGSAGAYSKIGTFTTAKSTKEPFTFMYFTDTQAQCDSMFDISQRTVHAAKTMLPNAKFALIPGDLVESSGSANAEWEYEQWFQTMQDVWNTTPLAICMGNHDNTSNKNFTSHFNNLSPKFDSTMSTVPGSYFSFVYGNALFMSLSYEDYSKVGMLDSAAVWMNKQVKAHPEVKWRIAMYHKTMFTGSASHQSDADGKAVREKMGPVFDSLKIDLALQGHDHVYEVIGPMNSKTRTLIPGKVSNQRSVAFDVDRNMTSVLGGDYNLASGTLYFLNSSAGIKKYVPRTKAQMDAAQGAINMTNYFSDFTGRFGNTDPLIGGNDLKGGDPMFSSITVSTDSISVYTYSVGKHSGVVSYFDNFKLLKNLLPTGNISSPTNGTLFTAPEIVTIMANANDADGSVSKVEFFVNNVKVGEKTTAPFSFNWKSVVGTAVLTAKITDDKGEASTSAPVSITVKPRSYKLVSNTEKCLPTSFSMPLQAVDTVKNCIGYDFKVSYDKAKVTPTGNITINSDLINPSYATYLTNIVDSTSSMNVTVFFNANAPIDTYFNGVGKLLSIEFNKTANFKSNDSTMLSIPSLTESYRTTVGHKLVTDGAYISYKDSTFTGSINFWFDNSPIKYDALNPANYLITNVKSTDLNCTANNKSTVTPDLTGKFTYSIWNGKAFSIERDIQNTTNVHSVINSMDAYYTAQVNIKTKAFIPTVFQLIAMDVNGDGVISAGDATQINQRGVMNQPEFYQASNPVKDWKFIDSTTVANNVAYKISSTYPENDGIGFSAERVPSIPLCLAVPVTDYDNCPVIKTEKYYGILLGDIDGSYAGIASNGTLKSANSTSKDVILDLSNAVYGNGIVTIPISISFDSTVVAFDVDLSVNNQKLTNVNAINNPSNYMLNWNFVPSNNTLSIGTYSTNKILPQENVISLVFATNTTTLSAADFTSTLALINGKAASFKVNNSTTGIQNLASNLNINVYPNPATDKLNIEVSENAKVQILDLTGKVIMETAVIANQIQTLEVNNLANGVYTVKVSNDKFVKMQKVVINK